MDADETGALHHFLLAFENVHNAVNNMADARFQLQQYYEQMKQSVLEDENYVDALLGNADIIYSVNLTEDVLEQNFLNRENQTNWRIFQTLVWSFRVHMMPTVRNIVSGSVRRHGQLTA